MFRCRILATSKWLRLGTCRVSARIWRSVRLSGDAEAFRKSRQCVPELADPTATPKLRSGWRQLESTQSPNQANLERRRVTDGVSQSVTLTVMLGASRI